MLESTMILDTLEEFVWHSCYDTSNFIRHFGIEVVNTVHSYCSVSYI